MSNENEKEVVQEIGQEKETSLDVIWKQYYQELDAWNERASFREETLLRSARHVAASMKQNRENVKEIVETFYQEQREWERTAREEFFISTTMLQYIFPVKSYEEMNESLNSFQEKLGEYAMLPIRQLSSAQAIENFVDSIEKYVEFRKNSRFQFLNNVKETLQMVQESQKSMYTLYTKQIKNVFFPFNKYVERSSVPAKS